MHENCETEIIEGLVYKNDKIYTGKCAFYDDNNGGMISSHQFNNGKFHLQMEILLSKWSATNSWKI